MADRAVGIPAPPTAAPDDEPPGALGLGAEIARARSECLGLARRVRAAQAAGQLEVEMLLHRQLNENRQTLRQLEKDTPPIAAASGSMVPFSSVMGYATSIKSQLECLPGRIATLFPQDAAPGVRQQVTAEVERILLACSEVEPPE